MTSGGHSFCALRGVRGGALCWLALLAYGCGDDPARVVSQTRICQTELLAPGLFVRASQYQGREFYSRTYQVISICNDRGGCRAAVEFRGPYAPLIWLEPNKRIKIEIAGLEHRAYPSSLDPDAPKPRIVFVDQTRISAAVLEKRFEPLNCADRDLTPRWVRGAAMVIER
jgi:hypothetical protein